MNYIKRLEAEKAEMQTRIDEAVEALTTMMAYLDGPKFREEQWVNSREVFNALRDLRFDLSNRC